MNISDKILKLRKEKGLSQEALAEALGVSRQSVSKWESGAALPDTDKIIAMSELFGVSTDYILKDDPSETFIPTPDEPVEIPPAEEVKPMKKKKRNGKGKKIIKITAAILALCIAVTAVAIPMYYGGIREAWWELNGGKIKYPYVFVHGLGGWGESEGINETIQYWGGGTTDLKSYLVNEGYEVYMPSVGPISSAWDRACELYAQLTGTTVDYGEAHAKEHNHARYGRTYSAPLFEGWGDKINGGQRVKINLIGHSFGGATVRLLTSLLEYGSEAEQLATGKETSPLFMGGKGDWVNSVTALCAPHNGSSLTEVLNTVGGLVGIGDTTELLIKLCFGVAEIGSGASSVYDFKLDHFGISQVGSENAEMKSAISAVTESGSDHAAYDLSPDGAAKLNSMIKTVEDVYYFSYSYSATKEGSFLRGQVPVAGIFPVLYPFAMAMGSFKGTTAGGIAIDETWQENDGLVSVVSARYPFNEPYSEFTEFPSEDAEIARGIWHGAPTKEGDHGTVIGLNSQAEPTKNFYTDLFTMIDSLER